MAENVLVREAARQKISKNVYSALGASLEALQALSKLLRNGTPL